MLDEATKIWKERYNDLHIRVKYTDPSPVDAGGRLGSGGGGVVYETRLGKVPLALKLIFTSDPDDTIRAEVEIMQRLAKERHQHIVQLIGSYQKRIRSDLHELGLLIWPVACCDLAALLQDIDTLGTRIVDADGATQNADPGNDEEDVLYAIETLAKLDLNTTAAGDILRSTVARQQLYENVLRRIEKSVGCIAQAVKWLHHRKIQHKDLKPSQILLSPRGLWLSDFGWSKDMSNLTYSTTMNGKTTTPKYLAPERASKEPCGWPQDIFSLGCIFLEMGYQVIRPHDLEILENIRAPWFTRKWCFSQHIAEARDQILLLQNRQLHHFGALIWDMLDPNPDCRPSIDKVVASFSSNDQEESCCATLQSLQDAICQKVDQSADLRASVAEGYIPTIRHDSDPIHLPQPLPQQLIIPQPHLAQPPHTQPLLLSDPVLVNELWDTITPDLASDEGRRTKRIRVGQEDTSFYLPVPTNASRAVFSNSEAHGQVPFTASQRPIDDLCLAPYETESSDVVDDAWTRPEDIVPIWYSVLDSTVIVEPSQPKQAEPESSSTEHNTSSLKLQHRSSDMTDHAIPQENPWEDIWNRKEREVLYGSPSFSKPISGSQGEESVYRDIYNTRSKASQLPEPSQPLEITATRTCQECNYVFHGVYSKGNLARHMRVKHRVEGERCSICAKTFLRSDALFKHYRSRHSGISYPGASLLTSP